VLSRPNFPRSSDDLPGGVQFRLLPFGTDLLTHFLYLERPEGMERMPSIRARAYIGDMSEMPRDEASGEVAAAKIDADAEARVKLDAEAEAEARIDAEAEAAARLAPEAEAEL